MRSRISGFFTALFIVITAIYPACGKSQEDAGSSNGKPGQVLEKKNPGDPFLSERESMVSFQIEQRGIHNRRVLDAMRIVPRHEFVPGGMENEAYYDSPVPIGYGQTISQPYIVALMTDLLSPGRNSKVLEVGTGSGYQAAILSLLAGEVYSVEIIKELHDTASATLKRTGYGKVRTASRDGYYGWPEHAPFDCIIVTCASEFIPPPLIQQLKNGGRMCIPVGPPFKVQHLVLVSKSTSGDISVEMITQVRFVPLVH